MTCNNPIAINDGTVINFGFLTIFNPYKKTVTFDASTLSSFVDTFGVSASFQVVDPNGFTIGGLDFGNNASIDFSLVNTLELGLTSGGALFFGTYTVIARIYSSVSVFEDLTFEVTVCHDSRMENANYIKGCITVDTNCSTAKMVIKEQTNHKYNGMTPIVSGLSYAGTVTYPDNYIAQKSFTQLPYQVNLNGSITGFYQVAVNTIARYELDECHNYLDITYRNKWADDVNCAGTLATLMCCWTKSLDIVDRGGTYGAQMEEKMQDASPIFNMALLAEFNGKNSEVFVNELQKLLGCDCKCQKGLQIQANPILIGNRNVTGQCGTVVTTNSNGDVVISSLIVTIGNCTEEYGFSFAKSADGCTQTWCMTVDYNIVQQQVLNAIGGSSDAIGQWQDVLKINSCPCKANVLWLSQNGSAPATNNPLVFSQVSVCGGSVISFTPQVADSLQDIVTYLNANTSTNDYGTFALTADGTGIVTSYVPTGGSCTIMVYLYQSCNTTVIVNGSPLIIDVARLSDYYNVLSATYFTKSDTIVSLELQDQTAITNGNLGTITITETTTGGTAQITTLGANYTLDAGDKCATNLIASTGTISQNALTSLGCVKSKQCTTAYQRVPYSERYTYPYRYNPQINDLPYYGDYIYINNSAANLKDNGSVIRQYNTVTNEVRQIAGVTGLITNPTTLNNVWGNVVEYFYATSVYVDKSDILNGQPTIYFVTYGGVFCKLVRERNTECDERANWKNYILAGAMGSSIAALPQIGTNARFITPYGAKRFGTINGQPSFIIFNYGENRLDFLYYKIASGPNNSANWYVDAFPQSAPTVNSNGNINVDRGNVVLADVTYTNIPILYVFGGGKILKYYYRGSETSIAAILNASNYTSVTVINQVSGSVDGLTSTVGRVNSPFFLSKITYQGRDTLVFTEEYPGSIPIGLQKLRGFFKSSDEVFTLLTIVPDNNKPYSTFGYATSGSGSPTANGASQGIFYHPTKSRYYEFPILGGIRSFCPNLDVDQDTILYANESGAASAIATAQDTTQIVDTNYELIITCQVDG